MAGKALDIIPFRPEETDIATYLEVVKPVLDIIFKDEVAPKIHTVVMKLGRSMALVSSYVKENPGMTWEQFETYTKTAINPVLGTVIADQQFHAITYDGDLDATISKLTRLASTAFTTATAAERKENVRRTLMRILPRAVRDHFAITEPAGYDTDLPIIRRILALQKSQEQGKIAGIQRAPTKPQGAHSGPTYHPSRNQDKPEEWARVKPGDWKPCGSQCPINGLKRSFAELLAKRSRVPLFWGQIPWLKPSRRVATILEDGTAGAEDYDEVGDPDDHSTVEPEVIKPGF